MILHKIHLHKIKTYFGITIKILFVSINDFYFRLHRHHEYVHDNALLRLNQFIGHVVLSSSSIF